MHITVQNVNVFLKDRGQGIPTLFLHGVPDTADIWNGVVEPLQMNYRCITPDWPGFGRSGPGTHLDCSLDGQADFVRDLADTLDLTEPFNLVSHDFGGISAMAFVAKYPGRVRRFVVSNAPFSPEYHWHLWARIWRTRVLGELSMATMNRAFFALSLRLGSRKLSTAHIHTAYQAMTPQMKQMILRMYRAVPERAWRGWDARLRAATAQVPTLVVWGQHDPYLPNWLPDRYGAHKIVRYTDSGHWVPAEEPARLTQDVQAFFSA